jgi:hypothetical protein
MDFGLPQSSISAAQCRHQHSLRCLHGPPHRIERNCILRYKLKLSPQLRCERILQEQVRAVKIQQCRRNLHGVGCLDLLQPPHHRRQANAVRIVYEQLPTVQVP